MKEEGTGKRERHAGGRKEGRKWRKEKCVAGCLQNGNAYKITAVSPQNAAFALLCNAALGLLPLKVRACISRS